MRTDHHMFMLSILVIAAIVVTGCIPVRAGVQTIYRIPYQYPGYPPANVCQPSDGSNNVICSGYLYQDSSGCIILVVTVSSPYGILSNQYYTLHNLPSSYTIGAWVTVTGQLYQGFNYAPNGAACPGNYINVSTMQ